MSGGGGSAQEVLARASQARREGRHTAAIADLIALLGRQPQFGPGWNLLGLTQIDSGQTSDGFASLRRATEVDPDAPFPWYNLANAQRAAGDRTGELRSLDQALSRDPYFLPALLAKGETLIALSREPEAIELYRLLFAGLPADQQFPENVQAKLDAARVLLNQHGARQFDKFSTCLNEVATAHPGQDLRRARAYAEQRAGRRQVYLQRPTAGHFPYLPAIEFFDRDLFPWYSQLERETDVIREELLALWEADDPNFRPYVTYEAGTPLNEWTELNWSPRWSAWFLWENGVRNEENCNHCPKTAAIIEQLPLLDIPGKAPTVMFSVLQPHTRIPPHTGSTNTRTTIHLPLIVPPHCGFRVGAEIRQWQEGQAWAFDDTIEHEAWNDSDQVRAILILDSWNPLLTEAERDLVRRVG